MSFPLFSPVSVSLSATFSSDEASVTITFTSPTPSILSSIVFNLISCCFAYLFIISSASSSLSIFSFSVFFPLSLSFTTLPPSYRLPASITTPHIMIITILPMPKSCIRLPFIFSPDKFLSLSFIFISKSSPSPRQACSCHIYHFLAFSRSYQVYPCSLIYLNMLPLHHLSC